MSAKYTARSLTVSILLTASVLFTTSCGLLPHLIQAPANHNQTPADTTDNVLTAQEVYELMSPSVVEVSAEGPTLVSTGTGFFYDNDGTIITNYHVIENCTVATIKTSTGATYDVIEVLGYDKDRDIAILSTACSYSVPLRARATNVKTGETVYAIGSSLGLSGSLSDGIISSASRNVDGYDYIQTTAPISHGNSGGPLIDEQGFVVGITSASFADGQNLNLAIPIADVTKISTSSLITLAELFEDASSDSVRSVEWIKDWDVQYDEDTEEFVLLFELSDEDEVPMSASGSVDIKIVNNDGVTVYSKTRSFDSGSFEYWYDSDDTEYYLASIYIAKEDITSSSSTDGTVYFTVSGSDYAFEECTVDVYDLPMGSVGEVEYLTDWDAWYNDDGELVVTFGFKDAARNVISTSGTAEIRIVNDSGVTVYSKTHYFSPSSFEYWYDSDDTEYYLATIYIDSSDVSAGNTADGTLYLNVYGNTFSFDECTVDLTELPVSSSSGVEYLTDWDAWVQDEAARIAVVFGLTDENEIELSVSGKAQIKIVDDNGLTVYQSTHAFSPYNVSEWYYEDGSVHNLVSLYIDASEISSETADGATLYLTVSGDDFLFDECEIYMTGLSSLYW